MAGNREADKGVTYRMSVWQTDLFHLEMKVDFDDWFAWATDNKIHTDVVGYLNFAKKDLYDFDPQESSPSFATIPFPGRGSLPKMTMTRIP